jgi:cytochrome b6-f complex iron-sulfur subunit
VSTSPPVTRRSFLTYLLGVTGFVGLGGLTAPFIRYAYPVEVTQVAPKLAVALADQVEPLAEAVLFDYMERPAALIRLEDGTPKAFYLACTHFGCISKWLPEEKIFYCACHAGEFAPDGSVVAGPPPRPLVELNVVQEGEQLFVEGTVA